MDIITINQYTVSLLMYIYTITEYQALCCPPVLS